MSLVCSEVSRALTRRGLARALTRRGLATLARLRTEATPTTHLRVTHCSLQLTFALPLLRHCFLLLSEWSILVTLSASCQLEFVNFRRPNVKRMEGGQSWLPGVQNWMQSLRHALSPVFSYKAWPAALVRSVSSSLPVYRALVVVPIVWQYVFFAARKSSLYNTWALSRCVSLPFAISCSRFSPRRDCFIRCRRCRRRSPRRISSSELAKRVLTSTKRSSMAPQSRNISNRRPRKTTHGRWGYGMGRSTALGPGAF